MCPVCVVVGVRGFSWATIHANHRVRLFTHTFIFTEWTRDCLFVASCLKCLPRTTVQSYWRCAESLTAGTLRRRPRNRQVEKHADDGLERPSPEIHNHILRLFCKD